MAGLLMAKAKASTSLAQRTRHCVWCNGTGLIETAGITGITAGRTGTVCRTCGGSGRQRDIYAMPEARPLSPFCTIDGQRRHIDEILTDPNMRTQMTDHKHQASSSDAVRKVDAVRTFTVRRAGREIGTFQAASFADAIRQATLDGSAFGAVVAELRERATRVGAEHQEQAEAAAAADSARVELLERVVAAVRPALPALVSAVDGWSSRALAVAPGLYLDDAGHWWCSREPGTWELLGAHSVLKRWRLDDIIDKLANALEAQDNGKALKRAEQLREKAEKLRAIATMLVGMR